MGLPEGLASGATPTSAPRYELRVRAHAAGDTEYAIWQLPAPATPHLNAPVRVAGLRGRNVELVEHRVLRRWPDQASGQGGPGIARHGDTRWTSTRR